MPDTTTKKSTVTVSTMARRNRKSSVDNVSNNLRKFINKIPRPISPPLTSPRSSISTKLEVDITLDEALDCCSSTNNGSSRDVTSTRSGTSATGKDLPPPCPTQDQIDLIRLSWEKVSKLKHDSDDPTLSPSNAFSREFFDALFEMDAECKKSLKNTFQQARAFSGIVMFIVRAPSLSTMTKHRGAERGDVIERATSSINNSNNSGCSSSTMSKSQSTFDSHISTSSHSSHEDTLSALPFGDKRTCDKGQERQTGVTTIRELNAARKRANSDTVRSHTSVCDSSFHKEMDPAKLITLIKDTGARHYFYSHVKPHFFDLAGPAFVVALRKRFGDDYTLDVGEAWIQACTYIAYYMKIGYNAQRVWEEQQHGSLTNNQLLAGANKGDCTIQ